MNKGIIGFIVGIIAVIGGAFVATLLLKDKIFKKDEEDDEDYDLFNDVVDDEEFDSFFDSDIEDIPEVTDEDIVEDDEEEVVDDEADNANDEQL